MGIMWAFFVAPLDGSFLLSVLALSYRLREAIHRRTARRQL